MPKQSALILALGFIIGSALIYLGLVELGSSIYSAGRASQPPDEINLKIGGNNSREPVIILDKSKN